MFMEPFFVIATQLMGQLKPEYVSELVQAWSILPVGKQYINMTWERITDPSGCISYKLQTNQK